MLDIISIYKNSKKEGKKLSLVTCYDYSFAKIIENTDIDSVLVGDSCGTVIQGNTTTLPVTLDEMIYHTKCVKKAITSKSIICDMPFLSYQTSLHSAVENAGRIIKETGCSAVKLEGGDDSTCEIVFRLNQIGIPVMGHLGLTPQSVHTLGGHRLQGKTKAASEKIYDQGVSLVNAGVFSIVVEMVPEQLGEKLSRIQEDIPIIGIGAGRKVDGQVLVLYDLLGMDNSFNPKFLKKYSDLYSIIRQAVGTYAREVKEEKFPAEDNVFFSKDQ